MEHHAPRLEDWMPIADFLVSYPHIWQSRKSFDWAQHRRQHNGMDKFNVTRKVGRRILVNASNCSRWIESGEAAA
jgi:hypothetical protein